MFRATSSQPSALVPLQAPLPSSPLHDMYPPEEHRCDSAAFTLMRRFGYDFMVRSFFTRMADNNPTEVDLIGVRLREGVVDCFEFKAGLQSASNRSRRRKRRKLRSQLRERREAELFNHVWGVWDSPENVLPRCDEAGYGSMYGFSLQQASPMILQPKHVAPALPIHRTRRYERMVRSVRRFNAIASQLPHPVVFLSCAGCRGSQRSYYPFHMDVWNSYEEVAAGVEEHSPFCGLAFPNRSVAFFSFTSELAAFRGGEWMGSVTSRDLYGCRTL